MNSQFKQKRTGFSIRQLVVFVLFMGLVPLCPCQTDNLWASEISYVEKHKTYGTAAETVLDTAYIHLKPSPIIPKVAVKNEEILYVSIVLKAAAQHGIDPAIIMAIIMAESGYNARAVSKKGAKGLMQLMPRTAKALGVKDIFCPIDNINGGVKYFKRNLSRFNGNLTLALAAYNAGSGNVKKYRGIPPFRATKIYVKKVLQYYELYKDNMFKVEG